MGWTPFTCAYIMILIKDNPKSTSNASRSYNLFMIMLDGKACNKFLEDSMEREKNTKPRSLS